MNQAWIPYLPDVAMAAALAWGAGLRLYLVVFALGLAASLGWIGLPDHLALLAHPVVIGAAGFMALMELFADKLPWLDSIWDVVQTFIRIPAGAALAGAVFGDSGAAMTAAAALLGGTLTATTHFAKAGTRAVVNTSPEPASNVLVSSAEDGVVLGGLWLALANPLVFLVLLALFFIGAAIAIAISWRMLKRLFARRRPAPAAAGPR
ncbi:MAG: DUF4126 domain-containing protein [Burkholderiaceae bacterium]